MYKVHTPCGAVVLKGLIFKLGIRTVSGTVCEQNGAVCFHSRQEDIFSLLPFRVSPEVYNQQVNAWIRTYDKSIVVNLGPDDLLLEDFEVDKRYFDVKELAPLEELYERGLVRALPKLMSCVRYAIGCLCLTAILWLLQAPLFPFIFISGALALYDVQWAIRVYRTLNSRTIYDALGNWINLDNGVTSLNSGTFQFEIKEK